MYCIVDTFNLCGRPQEIGGARVYDCLTAALASRCRTIRDSHNVKSDLPVPALRDVSPAKECLDPLMNQAILKSAAACIMSCDDLTPAVGTSNLISRGLK